MQPRHQAGAAASRGGQFATQQRTDSGIVPVETPWPAVEQLESFWEPNDPMMSHRQRLANRGPFSYSLAAPISGLDPVVADDLYADAEDARVAIERFDAESTGWGIPFSSVLLRSESASSSQIEHLTSSARRIALAALGSGDGSNSNATMIARNTEAMRAAIDMADHISPNTIRTMHELLDGGDDPENAGKFRLEPVWIGGLSPVSASFVAAPHAQVPALIDDLCTFARRTDLQPVVQAALAHAQFETIHPFTDGNGRTGRALVSAILRHRGVSREMTAPISSGLLADTDSYFAALKSYRAGDTVPIIEAFADASHRAVANAGILRDDVAEVRDQVLATGERRTANLVKIAELCASEPAFTADMAVARGVPTASVYRILERLEKAGIVKPERPIRGVTAWTVRGLTSALDRFAERAGRRTFNNGR
jgi:Fic family protein